MQMAATRRGLLLAILVVVAGVPASAKDYTVGDSSGWKPGVDYTGWAKGKTFSVGDTLCKHRPRSHSVICIICIYFANANAACMLEIPVACWLPCWKLIARLLAWFAAFQYGAGHSVLEVSEADHSACSTSNPLRTHDGDSSTTVPLTKPGTRYFICGAAGHCASGMKLAVTVSDGGATSSPSGPTMRSTNAKPAAGATAAATDSDATSDAAAATATASGVSLATGLIIGAVGFAALMG
jgi:hypothetical protein